MVHGILFLYLLVNLQLDVVGSTLLKLVLMIRLIAIRPAWLLKVILRFMVVTMATPSLLLPRLLLFAYFSPWQLCVIGLFISWILRMLSFMVNFSRKCIWSNHLVLFAQGESDLVCKLRRSLFGLKQSPRAWFGLFSSVVQEFGMLRSEADHSVFYHHNSSSQCIYLVVCG